MRDVEEILAKIALGFLIGVAVWSCAKMYWELSPLVH
jgi:hypothetical protein